MWRYILRKHGIQSYDLVQASKLGEEGKEVTDAKNIEDVNKFTTEANEEEKEGETQAEQQKEKNGSDQRNVEGDGGVLAPEGYQQEDLELKLPDTKDLEKEDWYHGYLPVEDIIGLLIRDGDFLLRGLEPEGEHTASVKIESQKDLFAFTSCRKK
ncbi:hypothetical protein OSTOST_20792 [Ostertagia ostertagi]